MFFLYNWFYLSFSFSFYLFLLFVLIISFFVFIYSMYYLSFDMLFKFYLVILLAFVVSMCLLVTSSNLLTFFFGWDGLGITSYFLVSFYFNYRSSNSAMTTLMSNRVGDALFFVVLVSMFYIWMNIYLFSFFVTCFLLLTSLTKSAQYPFSTWLPLAMAAPTPISALVHSSTLVTAGVFLLMLFSNFYWVSLFLCFLVSIVGLVQSGVLSVMESDLKKLVAFSTLNQIALILLSISLGLLFLSYLHLVIHAIFKSLLFLSIGVFIHLCFSNQTNFKYYPVLILVTVSISLISLLAIMFVSGMYSKELILESFFSLNFSIFIMFMCLLSISFTFLYTARFILSLFYKTSGKVSFFGFSYMYIYSLFCLFVLAVICGRLFFCYFLKIVGGSLKLGLSLFLLFVLIIYVFLFKMFWPSLDNITFSFSLVKTYFQNLFIPFEMSWIEYMNMSPFSLVYLFGNYKVYYQFLMLFLLFVFLIIVI